MRGSAPLFLHGEIHRLLQRAIDEYLHLIGADRPAGVRLGHGGIDVVFQRADLEADFVDLVVRRRRAAGIDRDPAHGEFRSRSHIVGHVGGEENLRRVGRKCRLGLLGALAGRQDDVFKPFGLRARRKRPNRHQCRRPHHHRPKTHALPQD